MRHFLRALAACWLACQIVAAAAPLTLFNDSLGIDEASCCPGTGPGQTCPMHHKNAGDQNGDKTTCRMESACAHHDAALLTILAVGVLPPGSIGIAPAFDAARVAAITPSTRAHAITPDAPPPQL